MKSKRINNSIHASFRRIAWLRLFVSFLVITASPLACAHDLEDGFVERAVQARIRDGKLSIEYAIGLTEPTMRQLMQTSETNDNRAAAETDNDESSVPIREHFRAYARRQIPEMLKLTVNGKACPWHVDSITDYPKHHYDFVLNVSIELSPFEEIDLLVHDNNFLDVDGAARYALKATGNSLISSTNVAPIIVRSKRLPMAGLKPDERHNSCKIKATIAEIGSETKD